tara:strand:+ start:14773 stop:15189 length:417 start_codon:yes stop_codon:yes gene_type:complete
VTIEAMGTGLKTRLATITQLTDNVWAPNEIGESIPKLPWGIIFQGETTYNESFSNAIIVNFRILIVFGKAHQKSAINQLLDYTERTGNDSVYTAISGDSTLGGAADFTQTISNSGAGTITWGNQAYLSTEFIVQAQEA